MACVTLVDSVAQLSNTIFFLLAGPSRPLSASQLAMREPVIAPGRLPMAGASGSGATGRLVRPVAPIIRISFSGPTLSLSVNWVIRQEEASWMIHFANRTFILYLPFAMAHSDPAL